MEAFIGVNPPRVKTDHLHDERREKLHMKVLSYSSPLLACSLPLYTSEYRSLPILILDLVLLSSSTFILSDYAIALETGDSGLY